MLPYHPRVSLIVGVYLLKLFDMCWAYIQTLLPGLVGYRVNGEIMVWYSRKF